MSEAVDKEYLYVFLDEGGNFDFSPTGTQYFMLTSLAMRRPFRIREPWDDYRHELLEFGRNVEYFHCAEDNQYLRDRLFRILNQHQQDLRIDSLIVEKAKTGLALRADERFYPEMLGYLLRHVFDKLNGYDEIIVITDTVPHQKKRKAIEKGIKHALKTMLPTGMKYRVLHQASRSHYGLQAADYCNWAIYRKWTTGETAYYDLIKPAIHSEFDIFKAGTKWYY
ncbi:DUF3800 domain-containing protein [Gilvimarinus agarilyticus]|uniref:DUF3800 domain-containing protein n=1 Tax=Gilvimarinus sp. 2_MG-2023 TaxID=3062666 RepID=UPI001C098AFB|nr:DUF3800 domain-containing protein [Gilvimarinus sp. 2_MG-2023]MBU2887705.1 DUF3800 domain-containing protein [Gilvimarinus agarilyticus]MDO6572352.1 DUF3800 domain-containing protein [Gilvimarinus sp. 2_MG-2023]